jgi:DNA repair exonuclease SbcCD ATPase subunit
MKLLKVLLKGFRTFRQQQWVELPTEPGLYLIRGVNEVDPSLEGNDVGKSTLWDAVYWCFYGMTTRGLKAGNVIAWGESQCYVGVELEIGGRVRYIFRQQNPNELRIDGDLTTQEQVEALLGRNAVEFLHSVLIGQFTDYFMDLGPSDKLGLFSEVLGLDYWEGRAELAKNKSTDLASEVERLASQLENEEGRLEALRERYEALDTDSKIWAFESRKRKATLQERIEKLKRRYRENQNAYREVEEQLQKLRTPEQDNLRALALDKAELMRVQNRLVEVEKSHKLRSCPLCRQSLGKDWREKLREEQNRLLIEIDLLDGNVRKETRLRDKIREQLEEVKDRQSGFKDSIIRLACKLDEAEQELAVGDQNPFTASLGALLVDLKASKARQRLLRARRAHASIEHARLSYWVRGFRDLRLWILDSTLAELEMRCNNSLIQLGLERWTIHLGVERETKAGGVTRGFQVRIESPGSQEYAPWKGWGGGVTQRLRLAVQMGLASLINSRKRFTPNVEVWDEPDMHLSDQGVTDLLVHLQARALLEHKQVWVVTHRKLMFSFDGVMVVRKLFCGSNLEKE